MNYQINCIDLHSRCETALHRHSNYEILVIWEGEGRVKSSESVLPFKKGSILIIPPFALHQTIPHDTVRYLYINGDLKRNLHFEEITAICAFETEEAIFLSKMIEQNRFGNRDYLNALVEAFSLWIANHTARVSPLEAAIDKIVERISELYCDPTLSLKELLVGSGYAEDYIRSRFKAITKRTPNQFLCEMRIRHAVYLIETYQKAIPLTEICDKCGFCDYIYFSKRFKELIGKSPREYRDTL